MIGSVTRLSAKKKVIAILVAISMVLSMSNLIVWSTNAIGSDEGADKTNIEVNDKAVEGEDVESVEPAAETPAADELAVEEPSAQKPAAKVPAPAVKGAKKAARAATDPEPRDGEDVATNTYYVTLKAGKYGIYDGLKDTKTLSFKEGEKLTLSSDDQPTPTGNWKFDRWGDTADSIDQPVNGDLELDAIYYIPFIVNSVVDGKQVGEGKSYFVYSNSPAFEGIANGSTMQITIPTNFVELGYAVSGTSNDYVINAADWTDNGYTVNVAVKPIDCEYSIKYVFDGEEVTEGLDGLTTTGTAKFASKVDPSVGANNVSYDGSNWTLDVADSTGIESMSTDVANNVLTLHYFKDDLNDPNEPSDPSNNGDGIDDKYQHIVTFNIVNGAWDGGATSITKAVTFKSNGQLSDSDLDAVATLSLPDPKPAENYTIGSWESLGVVDGTMTRQALAEKNYTLNYVCPVIQHSFTVNFEFYVSNGTSAVKLPYDHPYTIESAITENAVMRISDYLDPAVASVKNYLPNGYVFDKHEISDLAIFDSENNQFVLAAGASSVAEPITYKYYFLNAGENNYAIVNLEAENGTIAAESPVFNDVTNGAVSLQLPYGDKLQPNDGYGNGSYNGVESGWYERDINGNLTRCDSFRVSIDMSKNGTTFVYRFVPQPVEYTINFFVKGSITQLQPSITKSGKYFGETVVPADFALDVPARIGSYVLVSDLPQQTVLGTNNSAANQISLNYALDDNNDGIADECQVTVKYRVSHGVVSGASSELVTLYKDGKPTTAAEGGKGQLANVPSFEPLEGYEGGVWTSAGRPYNGKTVTADITFKITYSKVQDAVQPDDEGDNGDDTTTPDDTGAVDADDADAGAADAAEEAEGGDAVIPDDENPLVDESQIADEENPTTAPETLPTNSYDWLPIVIGCCLMIGAFAIFFGLRRRSEQE